jgi:hypothetical protein
VEVLALFCAVVSVVVQHTVRQGIDQPKSPNQHPDEQYERAHGFKGMSCEKHTEYLDSSMRAVGSWTELI